MLNRASNYDDLKKIINDYYEIDNPPTHNGKKSIYLEDRILLERNKQVINFPFNQEVLNILSPVEEFRFQIRLNYKDEITLYFREYKFLVNRQQNLEFHLEQVKSLAYLEILRNLILIKIPIWKASVEQIFPYNHNPYERRKT